MTPAASAPFVVRRNLAALFDPTSIAIVGASNDPGKYGNWLAVRALRDSARRQAYLINRSRPTILGHPASPSLAALKGQVDLAVIAVPAAGFDEAVDDAITAEVKAIVAITAGLGETGVEGLARQDALVARLRTAGIPMLGPNCLGVLDNTTGLDATVNDFRPGSVSIISQSGNVAIDLAEHLSEQGLGVSRFASLGNCADLDVADLIDSCVDHEGTSAIAVYCEGFKDGRKFAAAAARAASAGKPLVLLSVGRGAASTRGAASHTGSLVTSHVVLEAVCEATGAELVSSPLEMAILLQALVRTRPPAGPRVAVLADGGGHASLASDSLEEAGLHVEEFSHGFSTQIAGELPPNAGVSNPIDIAGGGEQDISCFARVAKQLVASSESDSILMTGFFGGYSDYDPSILDGEVQAGRDIGSLVAGSGASFVAQTMFSDSAPAAALRESGIAVYRNVEHASWAMSRLVRRHQFAPQSLPVLPAPTAAPLVETGYGRARSALAAAGIPFMPAAEVTTLRGLKAAAAKLHYPLVLKALGDEHKSDNGGVILNIPDLTGLLTAWDDVQVRLAPPSCSIEEMADTAGAVELIIGVRRDPTFGPIVLVGVGGVYTELLKDTRCALGPINTKQAKELLLSLRGAALLTGFRGKPAVAIDKAAQLLATLSHFAAEHPEIDEIECNPIAVTPTQALALDARIILHQTA
ncbi:acetate--CoA ligase family protein [Pseudarthrobacter sp. H2]|uniref:acetate--CoA ligase family protein n=1 Tax=Pseudarthrobacter sp. H2 TaxID=3418415 RepID=UPI003CF87723